MTIYLRIKTMLTSGADGPLYEAPAPERLRFPNPHREQRADLGPKTLAWCRRVIPGFKAARRDAVRAQRHAERTNARVRMGPK